VAAAIVTDGVRLAVATCLVFGLGTISITQVPTAPAPHRPLGEVANDYRRYGLPVPPGDASLVRTDQGDLGFLCPPREDGGSPYLLDWSGALKAVDPLKVTRLEPTPAVLDGLPWPPASWLLLRLAAMSKLRGWDHLGDRAYSRALDTFPDGDVGEYLRSVAWRYGDEQIMRWGTDREEVYRHLRLIAADDERFRTPEKEQLLRDLGLTVAPRKSRPGSAESLIDDLTEYYPSQMKFIEEGEGAYWKLAALGFDAIPALIEHAQDMRFTRYTTQGVNNFPGYRLRVGHVVSRLLDNLLGGSLGVWDLRGDMADPGEALLWWGKAQQIGEERWLLDHALVVGGFDDPADGLTGVLNPVILRAIRAKYPRRLGEIYQTVLWKLPGLESDGVAREIAASNLPREWKVARLKEGATHARFFHRSGALSALADVDQAAFCEHLLQTLAWLPKDIEGEGYWMCPEAELSWLVQRADDPKCWDALAATTRRVSVGLRLQLLEAVFWGRFGHDMTLEMELRNRRERIRYLLGFLDDMSIRTPARRGDKGAGGLDSARDDQTVEVRDVAAAVLVGVLERKRPSATERGPMTRFALRVAVRRAAERELTGMAK
jgi:hypothetical protein